MAGLRRFLAMRWMYLFDAVLAVALLRASTAALAEVGQSTVLFAPLLPAPPSLPPDTNKHNVFDVALAAGYEVVPMRHAIQLWWMFTALLIVALLIHRRWPAPALVLAMVGAVGHYLDLYPLPDKDYFYLAMDRVTIDLQPIDLVVLIVLVTFVIHARMRWMSLAACAVVVVTAYVVAAMDSVLHGGVDESGVSITEPFALLTVVMVFSVGDGIRSHRIHLRTLEAAAADLEREQQRAELATAAERARIARDLHDVVAHSLAVMVAQAQAAEAAQQRRPERTTQAIREIVTVGRASLAEMRRVLGALGPATVDGEGLTPQPGLGELPALVDRVRAAGISVRLDIDGEPASVPAGVDLSAYRIVQEALTNTLKHAGTGASSKVSVAYRQDHVQIEVTDDGAGRHAQPPAPPANGLPGNGLPGNGLRGIAERVNLLGGEMTAGPAPKGGFVVRVRLPLLTGPPPS
ncbi:MAG TPA: sensor histidine kinase [Candidatus Limnocylindrales bacterium]|nr:sensor histidine kinase [Candidatus Limnocylindrales bacterium]